MNDTAMCPTIDFWPSATDPDWMTKRRIRKMIRGALLVMKRPCPNPNISFMNRWQSYFWACKEWDSMDNGMQYQTHTTDSAILNAQPPCIVTPTTHRCRVCVLLTVSSSSCWILALLLHISDCSVLCLISCSWWEWSVLCSSTFVADIWVVRSIISWMFIANKFGIYRVTHHKTWSCCDTKIKMYELTSILYVSRQELNIIWFSVCTKYQPTPEIDSHNTFSSYVWRDRLISTALSVKLIVDKQLPVLYINRELPMPICCPTAECMRTFLVFRPAISIDIFQPKYENHWSNLLKML